MMLILGRLSTNASVRVCLESPSFTLRHLNLDVGFSPYNCFDLNDLQRVVPPSLALKHVSTSFWDVEKNLPNEARSIYWLIIVFLSVTIGWLEAAGRAIDWQPLRNSDYSEVVMFVVVACCCFGPAEISPMSPSHFPALVMMRSAEAHSGESYGVTA